VILKKLTLRGFRSFRDEQVVEFPEGPLFICGKNHDDPMWDSNAAGKTSLMVAVFWALWGVLPTGAKKDQVIHGTCDETFVEADFGSLVVRRRKTRAHPEVLSYFSQGKWQEPDLEVAQSGLEGLLGVGVGLAQNSIWVGPDSKTVQFLYARPAERLTLVESLTENALLEGGRRRANRRVSELKETIRSHEIRMESLQEQLKKEQSRLLQAQTEYQRVSDDNNQRKRRLENQSFKLKSDLRQIEGEITGLENVENVSGLNAELTRLKILRQKSISQTPGPAPSVCPTCRRPL
jgi:DNA repair exonuclease SbcCD ATPase subunit